MSTDNKMAGVVLITPNGGIYRDIPLNKLKRLRNHAFEDYKGEQFVLLVESIKDKGLIHPIVVRPLGDTGDYEILSGHNRKAAIEKLGWPTVPAMIRDMDDAEATLFANEANVTQRMFADWLPSEKSKSISQYYLTIKKPGRRSDLTDETSGDNRQRSKDHARAKTARVYGITENTVRLYLGLYRLIEPLKKRLDKEEFGTTPAQALSGVSVAVQELVHIVLDEDKDICELSVANARKVRDRYKKNGNDKSGSDVATKEDIRNLLLKKEEVPTTDSTLSTISIEIPGEQYERLFLCTPKEDVIAEIIEGVEFLRKSQSNSFQVITKDTKKLTAEKVAAQ